MELKHIRSFVLTAETASFSVAASCCYLTKSAISQHIKALEEYLIVSTRISEVIEEVIEWLNNNEPAVEYNLNLMKSLFQYI